MTTTDVNRVYPNTFQVYSGDSLCAGFNTPLGSVCSQFQDSDAASFTGTIGSSLYIYTYSVNSNPTRYRGIVNYLEALNIPSCSGPEIITVSGTLINTNLHGLYAPNIYNCTWYVVAPAGSIPVLRFISFDTNINYQSFSVLESSSQINIQFSNLPSTYVPPNPDVGVSVSYTVSYPFFEQGYVYVGVASEMTIKFTTTSSAGGGVRAEVLFATPNTYPQQGLLKDRSVVSPPASESSSSRVLPYSIGGGLIIVLFIIIALVRRARKQQRMLAKDKLPRPGSNIPVNITSVIATTSFSPSGAVTSMYKVPQGPTSQSSPLQLQSPFLGISQETFQQLSSASKLPAADAPPSFYHGPQPPVTVANPLPPFWTWALDDSSTPYYVNHHAKTTTYEDPRHASFLVTAPVVTTSSPAAPYTLPAISFFTSNQGYQAQYSQGTSDDVAPEYSAGVSDLPVNNTALNGTFSVTSM